MTTFNFQCSSLLLSKLIRVQSKLDNQVHKEMIGQVLWSQLPSDYKNIGLEKQQKNLLIMRFILPNFRIMLKKDCSFRIYQNLKITHADPDHLFLAITQNWAMRLFVGFVMQGHICFYHFCYIVPLQSRSCEEHTLSTLLWDTGA